MRKPIFSIAINLLLVTAFSLNACSAQSPVSNSKTLVPEVSVSEIQAKLNYLSSDDLLGRETGTEGIENAAVYIEDHFKENGIKPFFKTYRDSFMIGDRKAYNIVGVLKGGNEELKNEVILIGAHYDHIGSGKEIQGDTIANGANDNASGTVGVMELARQFSKINSNGRSIIFALFSGEEMGLKGSKHLAKKMKSTGVYIYAMINLEMIGVPMKAKDYQAYITGYDISNLAEKFNEYSDGNKILGFLPQAGQLNLFKRSDNYPFYEEFNVPAQTICTFDFSNYPYYHHVDDEAEYLDAEHMADLIGKLIPGILKMTNTNEKEIKLLD
ncbi:M28 family peptidase [Christiangramia salexigens]|uniref:Peptidase M28 n=1 Tax=Christiangramia salexigens TaxID=1913577 RepID=A0A1L3J7J5_9FLAO|nr:M28 family peptidase [Christiangramia salexigens]APG61116.1 peptidase M28 [Christiangramia salexigens]